MERISLFMAVLLLLSCSQALAHNVTVFAWVEGDTVHVQSKFSGGRRPVAAPIEVYDNRGNLLLKGVTDGNGEFSFKVPGKTAMRVVLLAGMGHKGEWTIPLAEIENVGVGTSEPVAETVSPSAPTGQNQPQRTPPEVGGQSPPAGYMTAAEIRKAVEEALEAKLKPVMHLLVETRRSGPSMTDVLGGIGYIIGLIGVATYFSNKRKS